MKLYDNTIREISELVNAYQADTLQKPEHAWPMDNGKVMILRNDMAFELGEGLKPGIGITLVTDDPEAVKEDEALLIGEDLCSIKGDTPYARIAIVRVSPEIPQEGQALFTAIRNLEYTKYHFHPEGFMMRMSASRHKECVRISKEAMKKNISFADIEHAMIDGFHQHKETQAVRVICITAADFNYKALTELASKAERITKTIDHIAQSAKMTDCGVCSLQKVCDEVEGLRELHFKK